MADQKVLEKLSEKIAVTIAEVRDPKEFYKDREGLFVFGSFEERIVQKAESVEAGREFSIDSFNLIEDAADAGIEAALPEKYLFTEGEVFAIIAELISKQPKGEEGALLNNGYANLFYTEVFVVSVRWSAGDGGWGVDAWGRGDVGWGAGGRVFSPATGL